MIWSDKYKAQPLSNLWGPLPYFAHAIIPTTSPLPVCERWLTSGILVSRLGGPPGPEQWHLKPSCQCHEPSPNAHRAMS